MTPRERILAVYRGETPDAVPYMLDLSHWFYHRHRLPWDLSQAYLEPECKLIDYHKANGVGFYVANLASFYTVRFPDDIRAETTKQAANGVDEIVWKLTTPLGTIARRRVWQPRTYSWGIPEWSLRTRKGFRVFGYAMSRRRFEPAWDRHEAWTRCVGDSGVVYMPVGYSCMGYLLAYWMGVEGVAYATVDWPDVLHGVVDAVNENTLELVDMLCRSPAEVMVMGDNFSSDIQPPSFYDRWSRPFYEEAIRRIHDAGKYVAVHVDGKLRNAIRMIRESGADCGDAITPAPMGDLTPRECRAEAGPDFILSGGVSPDLWLPETPKAEFEARVIDWLQLKEQSPRLIANAGDQVPPGADENRIHVMRDLVESHGRY